MKDQLFFLKKKKVLSYMQTLPWVQAGLEKFSCLLASDDKCHLLLDKWKFDLFL